MILGEEDTAPGKEASAAALDKFMTEAKQKETYLWIIDPIDGTTNFVHEIPMSMPSVACMSHDGTIVAGCIFDPYRDECFTATDGGGAFLNGKKISVDSKSEGIGQVSGGGVVVVEVIQTMMPSSCPWLPHLTSHHITSSYLTSPHLTSPDTFLYQTSAS